MYDCTAIHIHDYLERYGWKYRCQSGVWLTGWQGKAQYFHLEMRLCETFVHMKAYLSDQGIHDDPDNQRLLHLNSQLKLFRLVGQGKHDLNIIGHFLRSGFDYKLFSTAMGILGYYCDDLFDELTPLTRPELRL